MVSDQVPSLRKVRIVPSDDILFFAVDIIIFSVLNVNCTVYACYRPKNVTLSIKRLIEKFYSV